MHTDCLEVVWICKVLDRNFDPAIVYLEWFQNFVIAAGNAGIITLNTTLFLERAIFFAQLIMYLIRLMKLKHFIIQLMHNVQFLDTIKIIKYLKVLQHVSDHIGSIIRDPCTVLG